MCHPELFKITKSLKLFGIYELQKDRIEINVAMDVVMDVLAESEITGGGGSVIRRESEVVIAISSHALLRWRRQMRKRVGCGGVW